MQYRTLLRYRCEGGRTDPDLGPDLRFNPQTGYRIFFKAKIVKNMNGSTQRWRGSAFFFQNIMFKIFLKLLGVTRTRIRILGSGSVKKNSSKQKMQMIPDPDMVQIRESYQTKCECTWIRIPDSGIFMWTPDLHRIRTIRYGSPPPDLIGLELLMFVRVPGI